MTTLEAVLTVVRDLDYPVRADEVAYQINLRKLRDRLISEASVHARVRHTLCLEKDIYGNITLIG